MAFLKNLDFASIIRDGLELMAEMPIRLSWDQIFENTPMPLKIGLGAFAFVVLTFFSRRFRRSRSAAPDSRSVVVIGPKGRVRRIKLDGAGIIIVNPGPPDEDKEPDASK